MAFVLKPGYVALLFHSLEQVTGLRGRPVVVLLDFLLTGPTDAEGEVLKYLPGVAADFVKPIRFGIVVFWCCHRLVAALDRASTASGPLVWIAPQAVATVDLNILGILAGSARSGLAGFAGILSK